MQMQIKIVKQAQNDDSSQQEPLQYQKQICAIIPIYYSYRNHLLKILKEETDHKSIQNYIIPDQILKEKQQLLSTYRISIQENTNQINKRTNRIITTQKIIDKFRNKNRQNLQLLKKYQDLQIKNVMASAFQTIYPNHNSPNQVQLNPNQQHRGQELIDRSKQKPSNKKIVLSENLKINETQDDKKLNISSLEIDNEAIQKQQSEKKSAGSNTEGVMKIRVSRAQKDPHQGQSQINGKQVDHQQNLFKSLKSSKVQERFRNDRVFLQKNGQQLYQNQEKINKFVGRQEDAQVNSEYLQFNRNVANQQQPKKHSKNQKSNLVESRDNFDSYSQYKVKPYVRHNTPNFDIDIASTQTKGGANFFNLQKEKIMSQKRNAQRLHSEVNSILDSESIHGERQQQRISIHSKQMHNKSSMRLNTQQSIDNFMQAFKFALAEICEIFCIGQCIKYQLRNKEFQILKTLSKQKIVKGPLFADQIIDNVSKILKQQDKVCRNTIMEKIFNGSKQLSFEGFSQKFSTELNQNQYKNLSLKYKPKDSSYNIQLMLQKLFSNWLQFSYFEKQLKQLISANSVEIGQVRDRITKISDQSEIDLQEIEKFIYSSTRNKFNHLKVKIFFKAFSPSHSFEQFMDRFFKDK